VLRECADRLRSELRPYDAIGRFGGEEFLLLLLGCDADTAEATLERVRSRLAGAPVATPESPVSFTASFGFTVYEGVGEATPEALLKRADEALYEAKRSGKNRVVRT
jgi:diguanylate cyclase (GGDEF)-like protein